MISYWIFGFNNNCRACFVSTPKTTSRVEIVMYYLEEGTFRGKLRSISTQVVRSTLGTAISQTSDDSLLDRQIGLFECRACDSRSKAINYVEIVIHLSDEAT